VVKVDRDWTVGRTIDHLCTAFSIRNNNHLPAKPRIQLAAATAPRGEPYATGERWTALGVAEGGHLAFTWHAPK
jgi:hypothetical protein